MKKCTNCGKELIDEAKFCSVCGKAINEPNKFCQNCGSELEAGAKFCIQCGTAIYVSELDMPVNVSEQVSKEEPKGKINKINYILALAFAIPTIICAILCATDVMETLFLFLPSMIVFFALSKKFIREHYKEANTGNGFIRASKILTNIALPIGIVFTCFSIVSSIVAFFTSPVFEAIFEEIIVFIDEFLYEIETELLYELGISK